MDLLFSVVFAAFLAVCVVGLMTWHIRSWGVQRASGLEPKEYDYRRRQFGRRMQTSALLAIIAVSLPIGVWLIRIRPAAGVIYWGAVLLLVAWVGILAAIDIWATKYFYGKLRDTYRIEQARLQAELRRLKEAQAEARRVQDGPGNGKPPGQRPGKDPGIKGSDPENKQ